MLARLAKAGTCMSQSMPKLWPTEMEISGVSGSFAVVRFSAIIDIQSFPLGGFGSASGALGGLFQGRIGLVDELELLFRSLVAAIGVRVEALNQFFVARLDLSENRRRLEAEERSAFSSGLRATQS